MNHRILKGAALAILVVSGGASIAGAARAIGLVQAPVLAAVDAIEPGQWQLREDGSTAAPRSVCLSDPATLLQIEHGQAHCNRFIVTDQPRAATVTYTCPGAGNGRTTIKLESANDFHLETQGIISGAPFDKGYRAHRLGACDAHAR